MNGYEDLLFGGLPAALASIGAGDSVLAYLDLWQELRTNFVVCAVRAEAPSHEVAAPRVHPAFAGADHALRADLKTLGRMSGLIQKLSPGTDVKAMVDELIDRTDAELDYLGEAEHQRAFAKAFDGDPNFLVPKVVASAPKVVVSEWVNGIPLSRLITEGSQEERNAAAARMAEFEISSPYRVGLLHGDPHPGNFFIADDGRFGVLDFGAVGVYPDGLPPETGPIFKLARDRSYDELRDLLVATDFIRPSHAAKVTPDDLEAYLKPFVDPLYTDEFHFTRQWLQRAAGNATDLRGDVYKTSRNLNVPKNFVMVFRVLLGCVGIAAQLEAYAPYRAIMTEWVPGID